MKTIKSLFLALIALGPALAQPAPQPIYVRVSGDGQRRLLVPFKVQSGQTIEFLAGSTLLLDPGSTFNFSVLSLNWSGLLAIPSPTITYTGDATGTTTLSASGGATTALTLATVNSTPGTFAGITVDGKGRVTAATTLTTLSGYGITDPVALTSGSYANPAWITSLNWSKIASTPTTLSGYGITDPIVVTTGSYANPAWITSLAGSKLSGAYTAAGMTISVGNVVLGRATGSGAAQELTISTVLDALGAARGSVLYRGSSGWTVLAPGTAGYSFTTNGPGADASWAPGGGGGLWGAITGTLSNQTDLQAALNAKQASGSYITALTGDVTAAGPGSASSVVTNLSSGVTLGGYILATAIAPPVTPATGKVSLYTDSASKNFAAKNEAGVINHGVQTRAVVASNWIRSIGDDGSTTISQPAFTDVSGFLAATQFPAMTGEVTNSAGSLATTITRSIAPTMTGQWIFNLIPNHAWTAGTAGTTITPGNGGAIKISPYNAATTFNLPTATEGFCFALSLNLCDGTSALNASGNFYRVGNLDVAVSTITPNAGDQMVFFEYINGKWMERDSFSGLPVSATNGGTGIDTHLATGFPYITAGTWAAKTAAQASYLMIPASVPLTETTNATTIDCSLGNAFTLTLNGNLNTVTLSNFADGQTIVVTLTNTASNYTVTWGNSILWPGGTQPVQTVGAKDDVWTLIKQGSTIRGAVQQNY